MFLQINNHHLHLLVSLLLRLQRDALSSMPSQRWTKSLSCCTLDWTKMVLVVEQDGALWVMGCERVIERAAPVMKRQPSFWRVKGRVNRQSCICTNAKHPPGDNNLQTIKTISDEVASLLSSS